MRRRRYRVRRRRRRPRRLSIKKLLGRGVSRPYIDKRNRLMLGSGSKVSKQKGGFFPLAALAAAPPIIDQLGKLIK